MKHRTIREIQETVERAILEGKIKGQMAADLQHVITVARMYVEKHGEPK